MAAKKQLSRDFVRLLHKTQKFLIEEPRRFDMKEGLVEAANMSTILEEPPCGTACCIAGAGYAIAHNLVLNHTVIGFGKIYTFFSSTFHLSDTTLDRLFYMDNWSVFYQKMYKEAKTPLERACVGVARIEHFIATDGRE